MCDCNAIEIKNLKGQVRSIDLAFRNSEADLAVVRYDLADTTKTLDKYRGAHVKMSKVNSELKKSVSALEGTIRTLTKNLDKYRDMHVKMSKANSELRKNVVDLRNTKAELSVVRSDLADTTTTLDTYRELRAKMSVTIRTLTEERDLSRELFQGMVSEYADLLEDTIRTEERGLSRELFQGMVSEYADLLDRYTKSCDDYEGLASRFIWRMNTGHDEV